ncbi:hemagglutinin repeat-containing protein [Vogesella sp. XCS3]|uniref:hemagglutinin repeat-containing protein n=1 Tax=Vogesella sp. XCS3 TaxID=2877939 RepID=UPI001D0B8E22|nr:hemagglutinin repeat-containing protein [Vogesella sp. XCS3]
MQVASWQGNGHNGGDLRNSANYRAYEILYLNPADILSNDTFITPDGKQLGRAVVKLTPQTSSFFFASGRLWGATGERWRTSVPAETTRTIYYLWRQDAQASPDQLAGGDDPFAELTPSGGGGAPDFAYQYDGVQYSPQYGTCKNNCIQLVTPYQLDDPAHTIVYRLQHPSQEAGNEVARIAHHTAIDDVLAAGAGAAAVIRAGGNMQLNPGQLLDNRYSQIAAGGSLLVDGSSEGQGSSKVVNTAATLYRLHQFSNTHITYGMGSYQGSAPDIRETLGSVAASISANPALVINGGEVSNLDQGRNAPHVQTPAAPGAEAANVRGGSDGIIRVTPPAGAMPGQVSTSSVNVTLPRSSLYHTTAASSPYLIQTDPAFTQYRQWLGSDYMLQAMAIDPATAQQRLGDGFYEQKLIRDQVAQLTGRRFLNGYASDEAQYRALMDNGLTFARQYGLRPGVALSPEQMARLSSDIVWLVAQTVTLPDGSQKTELVPQVYVKLKPGDISADGALLAADRLQLKLAGDLTNQGQIAGRQLLTINADNLHNLGGKLQGQDIALQARTDIHNLGGEIRAGSSLQLAAGRDIAVSSTTHSQQYGGGDNRLQQTSIERVAGLYADGGAGVLLASAGRDLTLAGAQLANNGSGATVLQAGRDVNLATVSSGESRDVRWNATDRLHSSQKAETGTSIRTAGDLAIMAGQDLNARAANLASDKGAVALQAGRDLKLVNGENTRNEDWQTQSSKKGLLSSKTTNESYQRQQTDIVSSSVSGHSVSLQAGGNMAIQASQVVSDQATRLQAGGNIAITSATASDSYSSQRDEKKSGLMGGGGLGFTIGKAAQGNVNGVSTTLAVGSTVGSVQGDVVIQAGKDLQLKGSDVIAGQDITMAAQNVRIEHAEHTQTQQTSSYSKQSGLTVALSGGVVDAAQTAVSAAQAAGNSNNSRLAALQSVKAGLAGYQALQTAQQGGGSGEVADPSFAGVSVSLGSQRSQSQSQTSSSNASSSELNAGRNVHIIATGDGSKGADGVANTGDLAVIGSSIKAQNVTLDAARDITLQSAHNRSDTTGSNSSSGAAIGVSVGVGSGKAGISVFANANRASGKENGDTDSYTETNIAAGQTLTLRSGRDTALTGAQASGDSIAAKVGRNLTLSSQQDQDHYASQQRSISAGGSVAIIGTGGGVNASLSRQRIDSQYQSVAEQSGLYAGQGGFNVQVGGHTQLNGAVIASTASPEHNQLSTATLGWQDLQNRAEYRVESQSIGASSSASASGNLAANALGNASTVLNGGHTQGSASSSTLAAISAGSLTVRDSAAQQQDIATLRRDATGTANGLSPLFNKQAELDRLQAIQLIGDIGQQTLQIANTHKRAELNAATERAKADPLYANSADYQQLQATWGKGGSVQQAVTAVTAALQGLAGGDASAAIAGAAAPYLATQIKQLTTDPATGQVNTAANAMAHALLGATIAAAKGDNAVAGAAGAGSAPLIAATLAQNLYDSDAANLTESQKDTVAALTTLAGSLAGGLAGGNAASALAGGQGAKNEVENNSLNTRAAATLMQKLRACAGRCDVAQLSQDIQQQEQYWDKVVAERCGGAGASLAVCASTLNGLQESLSFISSALGMAKTPQERALLLATYNEQVRDINTATAQFEKLGASASVIDTFMTQTALILPDLALSVGGNGRPELAVKPAAGGQSAGVSPVIATSGKVDKVEALFGQTFASIPLSHTAGKQNGDLGETLALQLLNEKTTLNFQPLQNLSGHGCDGCAVAIHGDTITVVVMDAKSSQMGVGGAKNTAGDPAERLNGWLQNASISGDKATPENQVLAKAIQKALDSQAKVQGITIKVGIPAPGTTGAATFKVEPWPK